MLHPTITIVDELTFETKVQRLTSNFIASLPSDSEYYALPTLEVTDGGSFLNPLNPPGGPNLPDLGAFAITVPPFARREGSTYFVVADSGDIGEVTVGFMGFGTLDLPYTDKDTFFLDERV